jgi:hypothetical protein
VAWKLFSALPRSEQIKVALYVAGKVMTMNWLKGKKTYIIAAVTFLIGGYEALQAASPDLNLPAIPTWAWPILGGLGIGAVRSAITTEAAK